MPPAWPISLQRSGENELDFVRQLLPGAQLVAILVRRDSPVNEAFLGDLQASAAVLQLRLIIFSVSGEHDFDHAFVAMAKQRARELSQPISLSCSRASTRLVINMKAAKSLGLEIPANLIALTDELIE